jgi:hypothetical protein
MVGLVVSMTVTRKVQDVESWNEFVAEHTTVLLPSRNVEPDAGVQELVKMIPGSSVAYAP